MRRRTISPGFARKRAHGLVLAGAISVGALGLGGCGTNGLIFVNQANPSCSDAGPGTNAQPFCTVSKGAAVATAGQAVLVGPGNYPGDVAVANSGTAGAPITIRAIVPGTVTITGGVNGIKVSGKSWVTIKGFFVRDTTQIGIFIKDSSNVIVDGNDVAGSGAQVTGQTNSGIKVQNTTASQILGNVTHDNTDHGIHLSSASGNQVARNTSYGNARGVVRAAEGIFLRASSGNTVAANVSRDNEDSGIGIWDASHNNVLINNSSFRNADHGIDILRSEGQTIVSNTVVGNVDSGIELQGDSGGTLANNVSVENGVNSPRTSGNIRVPDAGSASKTTLDHDLVHLGPGSGTILIDWLGVKYATVAAFTAATGHEVNGLQADPLLTNVAGNDLRLTAGSPAIDSANSGAPSQPATDAAGAARVDDPATPNTGVGPRAFDDRGAFEYPG